MYLLGHNAHIVQIQSPPVAADPIKGITGSTPVARWQGDMQAWIDEDIAQIVRGQSLYTVSQTLIKIPSNVPVLPNEADLLVLRRMGGVQPVSAAAPLNEVYSVRFIDQGSVMLGFISLRCVRGGSS